MTQPIAQYCEKCGKALTAHARFCGRCGKPVPPPPTSGLPPAPAYSTPPQPVTPKYAAPQSHEQIIAVLPIGTLRRGFLGYRAEGFTLVLTNLRILVAQYTSELARENAQQAKRAAKQQGKGFFGQWGAVIGSSGGQRYLSMRPEEILNETAGNYFIANNQVHSVKLKEKYDPEEGISEVKMTLLAGGNKFKLTFNQTRKNHIKQILQQTLENRVR